MKPMKQIANYLQIVCKFDWSDNKKLTSHSQKLWLDLALTCSIRPVLVSIKPTTGVTSLIFPHVGGGFNQYLYY